MASIISEKTIRSFEKFNADLEAFAAMTAQATPTLYEDINTTRIVKGFKLYKNGKLTWLEEAPYYQANGGQLLKESEQLTDEYDAIDCLKFWKANLRRAKRYWATEAEILDKMADGEVEDTEE